MKKITSIAVILVILALPIILSAQPQPNDATIGGGAGSSPVGGGAPIGGGFLVLLSLAIGYGVRKIYDFRKKAME
ncbi:MAG: hypothetical protein FJY07_09635 [Bacteroidetes bacterium]|nr:hypothetical protein [Bacteroidota bacterium]